MILLADNEGPDQTVRMRRLILDFTSTYARRYVFAWSGAFKGINEKNENMFDLFVNDSLLALAIYFVGRELPEILRTFLIFFLFFYILQLSTIYVSANVH